jgi:hypothetical protein
VSAVRVRPRPQNLKSRNMGEIADKMIKGEFCNCCGVYLEPNEKVYLVPSGREVAMPSDGSPYGVPVNCGDCANGTL